MFMSSDGSVKARIIMTAESDWATSVAEVFRWSQEANGWVHVADVASVEELATIADLSGFEEFSEKTPEVPYV